MGKELKVLMMGGQRVGKSSALAAIMDSFINGPVSTILTARDKTSLARIDREKQTSIKTKLEEVKSMLICHNSKVILVDSGKTNKIWNYKLELSIAGSNDSMTITFTDINGEFFESGGIHQNEIIALVEGYDVFIVAIDTPFMMEARKKELVNTVINNKYNCIDSIHTFLTQIDDNDGLNAKLVIFTPIKCEKWAKEQKLEDVTNYVKDDYKTTITALEKYKSVQIEVVPIQTAGSIVFKEHHEAFVFNWKQRQFFFFEKDCISKCAVLPTGMVRLSNGTEMRRDKGKIIEDASAVLIPNSDIMRPNSWFNVQSSEYKPHNCEQLALHILNFMFSKVMDAKIKEDESQSMLVRGLKAIGNFILNVGTLGVWTALKDIFGDISIEKMHLIINQIQNKCLMKKTGEGIKILKECTFKKPKL